MRVRAEAEQIRRRVWHGMTNYRRTCLWLKKFESLVRLRTQKAVDRDQPARTIRLAPNRSSAVALGMPVGFLTAYG